MKKIAFIIITLFNVITLAAQSVPKVPCTGCAGYGGMNTMAGFMPCMMCGGTGYMTDPNYLNQQAYERGRQMGEKMRKEAEERANNDPVQLLADGMKAIADGDDTKGYEKIERSFICFGNKNALFILGAMSELGMGTDVNQEYAKRVYNAGVKMGDENCKQALQRISKYGYWEANSTNRQGFRNIIINHIVNVQSITNAAVSNVFGGSSLGNNSSSSYGSSSRKCSSCGGTGECSGCGGKKRYWQEVGQYTGHSTEKLIDCPICRGTGRCGTCHGKGSL